MNDKTVFEVGDDYNYFINESWIFNEKDLEINLAKWKREKGNNVLFITGLSGSGKTTLAEEYEKKYKAYMFEIDGIEHNYDSSNKGLLNRAVEELGYTDNIKDKKWVHDKANLESLWKIFDKILEYMYADPKNLYIIEGVQLFDDIYPDITKGKPIIIKGSSMLTSVLRRFKRNGSGKIQWSTELKNEFFNFLGWYSSSEKRLSNFKKVIKETIDMENLSYGSKDCPIMESVDGINPRLVLIKDLIDGIADDGLRNGLHDIFVDAIDKITNKESISYEIEQLMIFRDNMKPNNTIIVNIINVLSMFNNTSNIITQCNTYYSPKEMLRKGVYGITYEDIDAVPDYSKNFYNVQACNEYMIDGTTPTKDWFSNHCTRTSGIQTEDDGKFDLLLDRTLKVATAS